MYYLKQLIYLEPNIILRLLLIFVYIILKQIKTL